MSYRNRMARQVALPSVLARRSSGPPSPPATYTPATTTPGLPAQPTRVTT